jgi:hypothetical protein
VGPSVCSSLSDARTAGRDGMTQGEQAFVSVGLLMVFVGYLLIRRTRRKPLKLLFVTLVTLRMAWWIFGLGILAILLGVAASGQP